MSDDRPSEATPAPAPTGSIPPKGLVERVKDILLKPKEEWGVIDAEASTVDSIYTSYIVILAAIGPIGALIGQQVFGWGGYGITIKPPIAYS